MEMKGTGITRKIDHLGRIVLPVELRRALGIREYDTLEIHVYGTRIILEKQEPLSCIFCNKGIDLIKYSNKFVCRDCACKIFSEMGKVEQ